MGLLTMILESGVVAGAFFLLDDFLRHPRYYCNIEYSTPLY
jgi:hypothetical protein